MGKQDPPAVAPAVLLAPLGDAASSPQQAAVTPGRFEQSTARPFILKSLSEETRRSYQRILTEFFRAHAFRHPSLITQNDVLLWRDRMIKDGRRPATVATKLAVVRSFFAHLVAAGQVALNPASTKLVPTPQLPSDGAGRALAAREVRHLLSGPDRERVTGARDYALLLLMLRTSLRVSEAAGLRLSAIRWTHGRWVVKVKVKGGGERTLPLPADVKAAIDTYLKMDEQNRRKMRTGGPEAYVFQADVAKRGFGEDRALSARHVWHLVRGWGKRTGLGKVTPHDLRRTAITRALDMGRSYRQVQMMTGHCDVNSVIRYDRHRSNLDENAINTLDYDEAEGSGLV